MLDTAPIPLRSNAAERPMGDPWHNKVEVLRDGASPHFTRWQRNLKPKTQSVDLKLRLISG